MSSTKRIGYIDIAKGIAFIFIVVGHVGLVFSSDAVQGGMPPLLERFAFTFHLPTFFILSGYFFHADQPLNGALVKKGLRSLILPYAATSLIIILGCAMAGQLRNGSGTTELVRWGQAALWGAGAQRDVSLWHVERIGGIWFLLALFWAQLIVAATHRLKEPTRLCALTCFLALAVYSNHIVWLPFSIQSGLGCAIYLYVGMLVRRHGWLERGSLRIWQWLVLWAIWGTVVAFGGRASLAMGDYPLGVLDVLGGIAGCACICAVSGVIERHLGPISRVLQLIGRNTLPLFALHIAEDNIISWATIGIAASHAFGGFSATWVIVLIVRLTLDATLASIAYLIPGLRSVYFPRRKAISAHGKSGHAAS